MSFKPMFKAFGSESYAGNAQAFATEAEALASAKARFNVWTACTGYKAVESDEPVNYRWDDVEGNVPINR